MSRNFILYKKVKNMNMSREGVVMPLLLSSKYIITDTSYLPKA
jgi:hypothetical protein